MFIHTHTHTHTHTHIYIYINLFTWTIINSASQQNDKDFRSQSIKNQYVLFSLYWTLHEIDSAIKSTIETNTEWGKQFRRANPIQKLCHTAVLLMIGNELLILVLANFVTYEKVLTKWCYALKDLPYFSDQVAKTWPKSSKIARKVAGVTVYFQNTSSRRLPK